MHRDPRPLRADRRSGEDKIHGLTRAQRFSSGQCCCFDGEAGRGENESRDSLPRQDRFRRR